MVLRLKIDTRKDNDMAEFLLGLIIGSILTFAGLYWYSEWR